MNRFKDKYVVKTNSCTLSNDWLPIQIEFAALESVIGLR